VFIPDTGRCAKLTCMAMMWPAILSGEWAMFAKILRMGALIAMAVSVSGCWLGPQFYSNEQTVTAMAAGTYRIVDIEDPTGRDQIVN
jgi:hypothetical protein